MKSRFLKIVEGVFEPADSAEVIARAAKYNKEAKDKFIQLAGRLPEVGEWLKIKWGNSEVLVKRVDRVNDSGIFWKKGYWMNKKVIQSVDEYMEQFLEWGDFIPHVDVDSANDLSIASPEEDLSIASPEEIEKEITSKRRLHRIDVHVSEGIFEPAGTAEIFNRKQKFYETERQRFIDIAGRLPVSGEWIMMNFSSGGIGVWRVTKVDKFGAYWNHMFWISNDVMGGAHDGDDHDEERFTEWADFIPDSGSVSIVSSDKVKLIVKNKRKAYNTGIKVTD